MAIRLLFVATAALLAACSNADENTSLCSAPTTTVVAAAPGPAQEIAAYDVQQVALADQCVHRWAYRLAGSPDRADVVADAVMGACADLVFQSAYAQENAAQTNPNAGAPLDAFTGEATNYYVLRAKDMRRLAVFRVVEARAGRCAVPP